MQEAFILKVSFWVLFFCAKRPSTSCTQGWRRRRQKHCLKFGCVMRSAAPVKGMLVCIPPWRWVKNTLAKKWAGWARMARNGRPRNYWTEMASAVPFSCPGEGSVGKLDCYVNTMPPAPAFYSNVHRSGNPFRITTCHLGEPAALHKKVTSHEWQHKTWEEKTRN